MFRAFEKGDLGTLGETYGLSSEHVRAMRIVAEVLPFRVNRYVVEELIDWDRVPDDPIFQLTFPQEGMLEPEHFSQMADVLRAGGDLKATADEIRRSLNPHPGDQLALNRPMVDGRAVPGVQRKYRETVLIFPAQGQTCHAYCTYCFRWPQFVMKDLAFANAEVERFTDFIGREKELTDVLVTGGDPMIMRTSVLARYVEPLLGPGFEHIRSIRIGTKAISYWPQRFVDDRDADALLALFERVRSAGKHLALMAHVNHERELATPIAEEAVRRIQSSGAVIRTQAPVIRHVNDDADVWADMWRRQVRLGIVPYYMFIERDTGARRYFELPLARCFDIFRDAYKQVSGLARTVRGPSMSASPGKVVVDGVTEVAGEKVFALSFLQARDPDWVGRPFFARYDPEAMWLNGLSPAFGASKFFFE